MNALGTAIVWCMIQVTLFGMLAGLLYLASRSQDPRWRALLLLASLAGIVFLTAMIASPWPDWTSAMDRSAGNASSTAAAPLAESATGQSDIQGTTDDVRRNLPIQDSAVWTEAMRAAWNELRQPSGSFELTGFWSWRTVAFLAVAAIALVGLARLVGGLMGVAMLRRSTIALNESRLTELVDVLRAELQCTRPIALGECPRLATAATVGWRRPLILLPVNWRTWTPAELRSVLAHEIAHVCRADFATHLVAQIGLALHFYHPIVHWLVRRLRLEQELAADALAARVAGGHQSYLTNLAGLALAQPSVRMGWPVQAFLPTRGMLLRRIEMLRDRRVSDLDNRGNVGVRGWLAVAVLVTAGMAAAGLRAPSVAKAQVTQPAVADNNADAQQGPQPALPPGLYIDIRPALIFGDKRLQPIAQVAEDMTQPNFPGFALEEIEQIRIAHYKTAESMAENPAPSYSKAVVVHVSPAVDLGQRKILPAYTETLSDGIRVRPGPGEIDNRDGYLLLRDNHTVVIDKVAQLRKLLADPSAAPWMQSTVDYPPIHLLVYPEIFHEEIAEMKQNPAMAPLLAFAPLWEETTAVQCNLHLGHEVAIQVNAICKSLAAAEQVEQTTQAVLTLAKNTLDQKWAEVKKQAPPLATDANLAAGQQMFDAAKATLASAKLSRSGQLVQLSLTAPVDIATELQFLLPAVLAARDAAQRTQSVINLKQLALAMHNYADTNGRFPPAVLYGPDGKTPHSWRVALLPFLERKDLYFQYKFDEPWDSPNNLKLLEDMPAVFRHPKDNPVSTNSSYFVLTGPDTVFSGKEGTRLQDITDGTSPTLLMVEAKRDTPWTKPEDIPYAANAPLPKVGGWVPIYFNAAMCDGSVHTFPQDIHEKILRAKITRAGEESEANLVELVP